MEADFLQFCAMCTSWLPHWERCLAPTMQSPFSLKHLPVFTTQDDSTSCGGPKQSEFLTVPGSAHSSHHQQREMRRSSSEQAPCTLPTELTEMRSKSFDYGNLPSSRQGEVYSSASAMKERRRGYLVRQVRVALQLEAAVTLS